MPFEARVAFYAFCVDRCLRETGRHDDASRQLEALPLLREGLAMLWDRAENHRSPGEDRLAELEAHVETYASYDPDNPDAGATYLHDVSLVWAAMTLRRALRLLRGDEVSGEDIVDASYGILQAVAAI